MFYFWKGLWILDGLDIYSKQMDGSVSENGAVRILVDAQSMSEPSLASYTILYSSLPEAQQTYFEETFRGMHKYSR